MKVTYLHLAKNWDEENCDQTMKDEALRGCDQNPEKLRMTRKVGESMDHGKQQTVIDTLLDLACYQNKTGMSRTDWFP